MVALKVGTDVLYVKNALRPDAEVEPSLATAVTDPMLLQQVQNGFG